MKGVSRFRAGWELSDLFLGNGKDFVTVVHVQVLSFLKINMAYNKELRRFNISQLHFWQFYNHPSPSLANAYMYMQNHLDAILFVDSLAVA